MNALAYKLNAMNFEHNKFKLTPVPMLQTVATSNHPPFQILLVEDNPIIQISTAYFLRSLGCKIDIVSTGKEAVNLFYNQYDLILLDIGLPDIDGFTVAKLIRNKEGISNFRAPIIGNTAFSTEEVYQKALNCGISDIVPKLVGLESIQKLLEKWLKNN